MAVCIRRARCHLALRVVSGLLSVGVSPSAASVETVAQLPVVLPIVPGTSASCWSEGFDYARCCKGEDEACWDDARGFSREACCSAFYEVMMLAQELPGARPPWAPSQPSIIANQATDPRLLECLEGVRDGSPYELAASALDGVPRAGRHELCSNDFIRAAECIARLPEVEVALDLFLGAGCSAVALAHGLGGVGGVGGVGAGSAKRPRRRAQLFSFENRAHVLEEALSAKGLLGRGSLAGWWHLQHGLNASSGSTRGLLALQARLLGCPDAPTPSQAGGPRDLATVWAVRGEPYPPAEGSESYRWNALDVICQHRGPLDLVLIDTSAYAVDREWMVIELVCQPKWVLIFNLNLHSGSGWIFHRLELLGYWRLELRGHVPLHGAPWLGLQEVRRVRSWAIFSRSQDQQ